MSYMPKQFSTRIESITCLDTKGIPFVVCPPLSTDQMEIINPLVPPTSGIRMLIYDLLDGIYVMPAWRQYMFFRVFKAISEVTKHELGTSHPGVLLVTDDRPSANYLLDWFARILAYDGFRIYFQLPTDPQSIKEAAQVQNYSRMGTPHASASVILCPGIDAVMVITASHNEILWNGVKFYIKLPVPISGRVMQAVAARAIAISKIPLAHSFTPQFIDANRSNNDYILKVVEHIFDVSPLRGMRILLWPYLGHAPEIQDLFRRVGVELYVVPHQMEPPNPTINVDRHFLQQTMHTEHIQLSILLDSDRDRVVLVVYNEENKQITLLQPNTLYTAMHNILHRDFSHHIVNIRTIPSDPRGDTDAILTFSTGVGYKHLGIVLYSALHYPIDQPTFESGIFYLKSAERYQKLNSSTELQAAFIPILQTSSPLIFALWEESGGHTFNLLQALNSIGKDPTVSFQALVPPMGDKYPAEALLILAAMTAMGYNFEDYLDPNIDGTRLMIEADDHRKVQIIEYFATMKDQTINLADQVYSVHTFEQIDGKVDVIHLHRESTDIYFRPSGTGPGVRIYIFGAKSTILSELKHIQAAIEQMFR